MELLETLKKLKEKLSLIDNETDNISNDQIITNTKNVNWRSNEERMIEKLESLINLQQKDQKVVINAGGKRFFTTKHTLLNTKYFNIFSEMINSENTIHGEIFFDCSKKLFSHVLGVIRGFQTGGKDFTHENRYKLFLDDDCDDEVLKQIIKDVFPAEFDLILHEIDLKYLKEAKETSTTTVNPLTQPTVPNYDYDYGARGRGYDY